jgi:hypothetical protein
VAWITIYKKKYKHKVYKHKEYSPGKKHRQQSKQREIRRKIFLLQYHDPLIIPSHVFVIGDDVFYNTRNSENKEPRVAQLAWIAPDDTPSTLAITTTTINMLVNSFDDFSNYKQIQACEEESLFKSSYHLLDSSPSRFRRILIQARHLKSQVFHYDTTLNNSADTTPEIYISTKTNELPIVIDTGTSGSITAIASNFSSGIHKANLQTLKQVNGTTPVCGEGSVHWKIEDMEGIRRTIITDAYYVPDATIRLFSPQVYIGKDKTSKLFIDHTGTHFTLKCGTVLCFPINRICAIASLEVRATVFFTSKIHAIKR